MGYKGYITDDNYLYIDFSETRETKKLLNRAIESAKQQRDDISKAIQCLQVPDSVLKGYGNDLENVKSEITKEIVELEKMSSHLDYVMRRFEEVDNEFAARFRADSYGIKETVGLGRNVSLFGNLLGGVASVILQGTKTYSELKALLTVSAILTGQFIKNGGLKYEAQKMYDYVSANVKSAAEKITDFYEKVSKLAKEGSLAYLDVQELRFIISTSEVAILKYMTCDKMSFTGAMSKWFGGYIQNHVHDDTMLLVYDAMALVNHIPESTTEDNYKHNVEAWKTNKGSYVINEYIEKQGLMLDIKFGQQSTILDDLIMYGKALNGSQNACEVIATYNALVSLNNGKSPTDFPDLLKHYEQNGITLDGYFGTSPNAIQRYFEEEGYNTKMLSGSQVNSEDLKSLSKDYSTFVLTTYNNKDDISRQIHTMSITYENGQYILHNSYVKDMKAATFNTLEEALKGYKNGEGETISVIGIK